MSSAGSVTALNDPLAEKLRKNGWSKTPKCTWLVPDRDGNPCCRYRVKNERLSALPLAQFTVFNQRYVDEAIANWVENFPEYYSYPCAPDACPSRLTRLLNSVHQ